MERNGLQMLHHIEHGICRTLPFPHNCVSPPCTFAEIGDQNYEQKMEYENIWLYYSLLPSNVYYSGFCCFFFFKQREGGLARSQDNPKYITKEKEEQQNKEEGGQTKPPQGLTNL